MVKICILADTHLFSTDIGGKWSEDSFNIFREKILPKIKEKNPDIFIFLGDIFLGKNSRMPNWPRGDEISLRFSHALKESGIKKIYTLKGNHDLDSTLRNINETGILNYIDNDWLIIGDIGFYFFTSRYPYAQQADNDLKNLLKTLPDPEIDTIKKRILLMHETLTIGGINKRISENVIDELSRRFYLIFNGHQHSYEKVNDNIWCIPSALPCIPWDERCDIFVENEMRIEHTEQWGFFYIDTDKDIDNDNPLFEHVNIGIDIIVINLSFNKESATKIRERLIEVSKKLVEITTPEKTIVRIRISGELNEGERKLDIGILDIERGYFSNFYEGKREIISHKDLEEVITNTHIKTYTTKLQALNDMEIEEPGSIEFYNQIEDFMIKKGFNWKGVLQEIKESKLFGAFDKGVLEIPKNLEVKNEI